jgi:hypothetical protein
VNSVDLETFGDEIFGEEFAEFDVIINDENAANIGIALVRGLAQGCHQLRVQTEITFEQSEKVPSL